MLGWTAKRELSKINYRIHTDAIKQNLIPAEFTPMQASINELICISNMENLNAVFIDQGMSQSERLVKLNQIAIQQLQSPQHRCTSMAGRLPQTSADSRRYYPATTLQLSKVALY